MPEEQKFFIQLRWEFLSKEHFEKLGEAIWLLLKLLTICDWQTGDFKYSQTWMARELGVSRATIWRWHQRLETGGYLNTERGRYELKGRIKDIERLVKM